MSDQIVLNNGSTMPVLGLGLYKVTDQEMDETVSSAVRFGYSLFDTASSYKNEESVGRAIRRCGVPREKLFVTTKLWNNAQRIGNVEGAFNRSLERLGLDYVDLYLVHWPVPGCYLDSWKAMEDICRSGKAKAIGVANFSEYELSLLLEHCDILPAVNQIEYHPLYNQEETRAFCQKHGIAVQAYSPLARGAYLESAVLRVIAAKYERTTAQIGLRWLIQKGVSIIPKASKLPHLQENSRVFDFELDDRDIAAIDGLNENYRSASIPEDLLH